jgi:hypothetical protein
MLIMCEVLQEVAATRYISVACGTKELTGTIFLRGLAAWIKTTRVLDYRLQSTVPSVLLLMDKDLVKEFAPAEVRDRDDGIHPSTDTSLSIAPLAELLERFHTHNATDRRDKVYALLGLCSDRTVYVSLRPDYTKDWSVLFADAIRYFLGSEVKISTSNDTEEALITGPRYPLGTCRTRSDGKLILCAPHFHGMRSRDISWTVHFPLTGFDENIRSGDILCLMKGAVHPSLVRRCGDYIVVVKIALTRFPTVIIQECSARQDFVQDRLMSWLELSANIGGPPRHFALVWDWSPGAETRQNHHRNLFEEIARNDEAFGKPPLCFNTVRILEDLEDLDSLRSLLESTSTETSGSSPLVQRHFSMLRQLCNQWDAYKQPKIYVSQLRWSCWALSCSHSQTALDPLTSFWQSRGFLGFDLLDITRMVGGNDKRSLQISATNRKQMWEFGEGAIEPLLVTVSPAFAELASTATRTSLGSLVRRFMTRVISPEDHTLLLHPKPVLDMLETNPRLLEAAKMSLTILVELRGIKLESTSYILHQIRPKNQQPNWDMMSFLLEESFADIPSVVAILQEAQAWSSRGAEERHQACSQFFIPCAAVLSRYLVETSLCEALVEEWALSPDGKVSVFQCLCDTYTSPFKDMLDFQDDALVLQSNCPQNAQARVELARSCLLGAMHVVAPWIETPHDLGYDGYPLHLLVSLQLLWSSKGLYQRPMNDQTALA